MKSHLFSSIVSHDRFIPFKNNFKYRVLSIFCDYDEIEYLSKNFRLFSYNKFNFFSFYERDHGYRDGRLLNEYITSFLIKNKVEFSNLKIKILCFPRILGYVFNPLSVIYCYDKGALLAIFYEVKNTPNEQHTYCFADNNRLNKKIFKHRCNKIFYVSPFIKMNCNYRFLNKVPKEDVLVAIKVLDNMKKNILFASLVGKKVNFSSFNLIKQFIFNPFIMYKVIFFILFQSIVIKIKGGKYYARKKKPKDSISFEGSL